MNEHHEQHVHLHLHLDEHAMKLLAEIPRAIHHMEHKMSKEMDDLGAAVAKNNDVVESAITLLGGIKDQLDAAIASNDPAALQKLSDSLAAEDQKLADAIVKNTPAETVP